MSRTKIKVNLKDIIYQDLQKLSKENLQSIIELAEAVFQPNHNLKVDLLLQYTATSNIWQKILLNSIIILKINYILIGNNIILKHIDNNLFYNRLTDSLSFYFQVNKLDNGDLAKLMARLREILEIN